MQILAEDMLPLPRHRRYSKAARIADFVFVLLMFAAMIAAVIGIRFVVFEYYHGNEQIVRQLFDILR
jgi:hypothetical protein